ncbi:MAG: hypothetical protein MUO75_02325 [Actinobacteria bacterium]|nr:hypothetical protein [Actinomycetota bacterium]
MKDWGVDPKQLMEGVGRIIADPAAVIDDTGKAERPGMYKLDYLDRRYPTHARGPGGNLGLVYRDWEIDNEVDASSTRKFLGRPVVMAKRIVRALTGWYVNPLVRDIRDFNMLVTRTLFDINKNIEELEDSLDSLEKAEAELQKRITEKGEAEPL